MSKERDRLEDEKAMLLLTVTGLKERAERAEARVKELEEARRAVEDRLYAEEAKRLDAEAENEALRAEALRHAGECARYAANDRAVIADLKVEVQQAKDEGERRLMARENETDELIKAAERERDEARAARDRLRDALRSIPEIEMVLTVPSEHWPTAPITTAKDLAQKVLALASGEESRHD